MGLEGGHSSKTEIQGTGITPYWTSRCYKDEGGCIKLCLVARNVGLSIHWRHHADQILAHQDDCDNGDETIEVPEGNLTD